MRRTKIEFVRAVDGHAAGSTAIVADDLARRYIGKGHAKPMMNRTARRHKMNLTDTESGK